MRFPFTQQLPNAVDAGVRAPEAEGLTGGRVQFSLATPMGIEASELNLTSGGGTVSRSLGSDCGNAAVGVCP